MAEREPNLKPKHHRGVNAMFKCQVHMLRLENEKNDQK